MEQKPISIIRRNNALPAKLQIKKNDYSEATGEGSILNFTSLTKKIKSLSKEDQFAIYKIVEESMPKGSITTSGSRSYFNYTKLPQSVKQRIVQSVEMACKNMDRIKVISSALDEHNNIMSSELPF
jgi:hypothetical protein